MSRITVDSRPALPASEGLRHSSLRLVAASQPQKAKTPKSMAATSGATPYSRGLTHSEVKDGRPYSMAV